jgi:hypothetical protein
MTAAALGWPPTRRRPTSESRLAREPMQSPRFSYFAGLSHSRIKKTPLTQKLTSMGRPKNSASCAGKHMRRIDFAYA